MSEEQSITRRSFARKTVAVGSSLVMVPSFVDVVKADTASGYVELQTTATVPGSTSIDITVFEDTSGDGTADRQQTKSIPNGTTTTEYDLLQSAVAQGDVLWMEIGLSTTDDTVTPELDTATLSVPAEESQVTTTEEPGPEPTEPQSLARLWHNPRAFITAMIIAVAGIGLWSKALVIGAWAGYMTFLYIAFTADGLPIFQNIAVVILVLTFLGFAFKLIRLEFEGEA